MKKIKIRRRKNTKRDKTNKPDKILQLKKVMGTTNQPKSLAQSNEKK